MDNFLTLDEYKNIIKKANRVIMVKDAINTTDGLILRHDVDESLDFAYELYKLEKEIGVKSTYYILLTSDLYNPFSFKNKKIIREMHQNGFEIGLHFDPIAYSNQKNDFLLQKFMDEIEIFEKYLEIKLYSYSMHQPSVTGTYIDYPKLINAYGSPIFDKNRYISDSSFSFRGKNIEEYIEKSKNQLIQLLIHPDHLFCDGKKDYGVCFSKLLNNYINAIDSTYQENRLYQTQRGEFNLP